MHDDIYDLRLNFRVKIKRWRIDDQSIPENREWVLKVWDRNLEQWQDVTELNRPGEDIYIESVEEVDSRAQSGSLEGVNSVL